MNIAIAALPGFFVVNPSDWEEEPVLMWVLHETEGVPLPVSATGLHPDGAWVMEPSGRVRFYPHGGAAFLRMSAWREAYRVTKK
jgi:hypothetical protein